MGRIITKTVADYPHLVEQWHWEKNGNIKPEDVSYRSKRKIWWKCHIKYDHEWYVSPDKRFDGQGCPCCGGRKVVNSNCLLTTHPNIAAQWHPTKNGTLTPKDVVVGSTIKIWWVCLMSPDHEWRSTIVSREKGRGCPCCNGKKVVNSNCLLTTHQNIAAQWHPTKNGTLTPKDVVAGSGEKAWWTCPVSIDHEWQAYIYSRTAGTGCPCCNGKKVVNSNCLLTTHPNIAAQWHPTKNGEITSRDVVAGSDKKIWWICHKNDKHEWKTAIGKRTNGQGCPMCNESSGEKIISKYFDGIGIDYKIQHKFDGCRNKKHLPFDFVVYKNNRIVAAIEYQGMQHYESDRFFGDKNPEKSFKELKKRDTIKKQWCKDNKMPLLEIPYWDFDNIETILHNFLTELELIK